MGNPIAHSKSPRIHMLFAAQTDQYLHYEAILVALDGFAAALERFQQAGGKGLNVTVPFKREAWECMDRRSPRAESAGAVNTIVLDDDGSRYGDNTDGVGLVRDLTANHGVVLARRRLLVLGAGGAVRGVLQPLIEQEPERIVIANRTVARAEELAERFGSGVELQGCGFEALAGRAFDVVINGTAASLQGELPPLPAGILAAGACCYDMMYGDRPTAFMEWGQEQGAARCLDGLGMLVEQAAESFQLWRGVRPQTAPVIAALRRGSNAGP
jgi:shikimate dehydrogenase